MKLRLKDKWKEEEIMRNRKTRGQNDENLTEWKESEYK